MKALKDFNAKGIVISESPNIEEDATLVAVSVYLYFSHVIIMFIDIRMFVMIA